MNRVLVVVVAIIAIAGLAWGATAYVRSQATGGETVEIEVGETWEVALESSPGTGYAWTVQYDQAILELADERYEEPQGGLLGAAGTQVFTFRGVAKGSTLVLFSYERSWEGEAAETQEYSVTVK